MSRLAISGALNLLRNRGGFPVSSQLIWNIQNRGSHWQSSLLGLRAAMPMRAEPKRKKKVDPKREHAMKERLKKKIKKLEKAAQEFIPIEDFITPLKFMDNARVRDAAPLPVDESERRAVLLKRWSSYKQKQHLAEMDAARSLVAAQEKALQELRLESEELYQAAIRRDDGLFPFESKEPTYTPPLAGYDAPNGKCIDITPTYTH